MFYIGHVGDAQLTDALVFIELQEFLHFLLHLIVIEQAVNHFLGNQVFLLAEGNATVCIFVQFLNGQFAASGHLFTNVLPQSVDVGLCLLAIGIAHVVFRVHLCGTLIFAHFDDLHLHAHLCQQVFHEERL